MPDGMLNIVEQLDRLACYDGPWRVLRDQQPLLRDRIEEIRCRETRLDSLLVVALVGGSGVGKSTLLNALAGDELAETSEMRPCTARPTVYQPPGAHIDLPDWKAVSGSALDNLILIDTPDSDTIMHEHREQVVEVLKRCDLIALCASPEKYLDEATWSLLRPLREERSFVCIETKAQGQSSIREHWLGRLNQEGFDIAACFRVNALRALDRKLGGGVSQDTEGDFAALEAYLRDTLDREQVSRIKRSNALGLVRKTVAQLDDALAPCDSDLEAATRRLHQCEEVLTREIWRVVREHLFEEPHLWTYVLAREFGLRAKGVMGNVMRVLEFIRSLPVRMSRWIPGTRGEWSGRHAASLLSDRALFRENIDLTGEELAQFYADTESELDLALMKAGFDSTRDQADTERFRRTVDERVSRVLQGPARQRLVRYAAVLTSWPATLLADIPVLAIAGMAGYKIVREYFSPSYLAAGFFLHTASVLAIVVAAELLVLSLLQRVFAFAARRGALRDLRAELARHFVALEHQHRLLGEALELKGLVDKLRREIGG